MPSASAIADDHAIMMVVQMRHELLTRHAAAGCRSFGGQPPARPMRPVERRRMRVQRSSVQLFLAQLVARLGHSQRLAFVEGAYVASDCFAGGPE